MDFLQLFEVTFEIV